jgi:hypothetical protein
VGFTVHRANQHDRACLRVPLAGGGEADKLAQHLTGRLFREQASTCWAVCPFLFYALEQLNVTFTVRLSMQDAAVMFTAAKDSSRSWNDHFLLWRGRLTFFRPGV